MCLAIFIVHDNVHPDFEPRQWAQASLLISAFFAALAVVFLIRAAVVWDGLPTTGAVLTAALILCWTTAAVSYLVAVYARTLPPSQTVFWKAPFQIQLYFSLLYLTSFSLSLSLFIATCWPALSCTTTSHTDNDDTARCSPAQARLAIELSASHCIALFSSAITTVLIWLDLRAHDWIPLDTSGAFDSKSLLPVAVDSRGRRTAFVRGAKRAQDPASESRSRKGVKRWTTSRTRAPEIPRLKGRISRPGAGGSSELEKEEEPGYWEVDSMARHEMVFKYSDWSRLDDGGTYADAYAESDGRRGRSKEAQSESEDNYVSVDSRGSPSSGRMTPVAQLHSLQHRTDPPRYHHRARSSSKRKSVSPHKRRGKLRSGHHHGHRAQHSRHGSHTSRRNELAREFSNFGSGTGMAGGGMTAAGAIA